MAESVVTFLLENLTALLQEEAKKLSGIREEAFFIKDELERMRAFLRVADMIEDGDEEIRVWVKQVREVAFNTEDVLDEFIFLYSHYKGNGFSRILLKKARSVKNLRARRRIASELESIKSRLTNISDGHLRYLYKLNIVKQGSTGAAAAAHNYSLNDLRRDAQLVEEDQLVGIEKPKNKIIKQLLEGKAKLQVVAVAGMGGLGKTTLVSKVFSDPRVKKHFQHQAFVTVSQFKQYEILSEVIQQLFNEMKQPLPQGADSADSCKLKRIIVDFLREKRYLVVLDDMWNLDSWESLKLAFPNNSHGSRLMITTRNIELTSTSKVDLGGMIYDLKPLSSEESWTLFCAKAFQGNQCPPHLEKSSRNILKRCEGLPLAIVAISGLLATKDSRIDEWEKVDRSVGAEFQGNDKLKSMSKILSLSFSDLPYNLKSCFMYFSMFPEDYLIERSRLIRFWIAEGFVLKKEGRTPEEIGETYFTELLNRSLIQAGETGNDGKIKTCRVHDLLREIILLKSKDQNFAAIVNEENINSLPQGVRRLSVHRTMEHLRSGHYNLSKLRSFLFFEVDTSPSSCSISKLLEDGLRFLKVLDCRGAALDKFPKVILKLYNLRYLSLRGTQVSSIPRSIRKLKNLETLDLRDTNVVELPVEILQIHGLRHILVYRLCNPFTASCQTIGFKALPGIETLSCLQSLCFIEASKSFTSGLMESLGKLKQLRRLGVLKLKERDGYALCTSIQKMKFLYSLSIESENSNRILNLQNISSPPQCLKRLYMSGRLVKLPSWVSSLSCLVRLYLRWSKLEVDPLIHLQALPNLVQLIFEQAYNGKRLRFQTGGFQMLKILMFGKLERLEEVLVEKGSMPRLEELWFRDCKLLKKVPCGVGFLTELKYLEFVDMAPELIKRLGRSKIYEDYDKIKHVLSIFTGNQRDWGVDGNYLDA